MSKNALHYAQETFGIYVEKSVYNPYNKKNGGFILETDQLRWDKMYHEQKIITYLETILERLPYEPKVMTDE